MHVVIPDPPRYLLCRALGALVPYIVGTWGFRVYCHSETYFVKPGTSYPAQHHTLLFAGRLLVDPYIIIKHFSYLYNIVVFLKVYTDIRKICVCIYIYIALNRM